MKVSRCSAVWWGSMSPGGYSGCLSHKCLPIVSTMKVRSCGSLQCGTKKSIKYINKQMYHSQLTCNGHAKGVEPEA